MWFESLVDWVAADAASWIGVAAALAGGGYAGARSGAIARGRLEDRRWLLERNRVNHMAGWFVPRLSEAVFADKRDSLDHHAVVLRRLPYIDRALFVRLVVHISEIESVKHPRGGGGPGEEWASRGEALFESYLDYLFLQVNPRFGSRFNRLRRHAMPIWLRGPWPWSPSMRYLESHQPRQTELGQEIESAGRRVGPPKN